MKSIYLKQLDFRLGVVPQATGVYIEEKGLRVSESNSTQNSNVPSMFIFLYKNY
jgi:hypothetical protein